MRKLFQSHIGAIRINSFDVIGDVDLHFNPTLVQLEYAMGLRVGQRVRDFNPTLVQLEYRCNPLFCFARR